MVYFVLERCASPTRRRNRTASRVRNLTEYEGTSDIDKALVEAVIRVALEVEARVIKFGPVISAGKP